MGRQHSQSFDTALGRVRGEMKRSVDQYGPLSQDPHRALAIIMKELGEVAEAINHLTKLAHNTSIRIGDAGLGNERDAVVDELVQVAQLCMQFIMNIEEAEEAATEHYRRQRK